MDPSMATQVLEGVEGLITKVSLGMEAWAWAIFTVFTFLYFIVGYTIQAAKGDLLAKDFFGVGFITKFLTALLIFIYFSLPLVFMQRMREWGMELSGSELATVDIGEIARQADVVTLRVNETIEAFKELGWVDRLGAIPEVAQLRFANGMTRAIFGLIGLISIWVYLKFMLGYIVGGFFIGFVTSDKFEYLGWNSFKYILVSSMPLFLLALLQGYSAVLLNGVIADGGTIKVAELSAINWQLGAVLLLSLAAVAVPREWLASAVGMAGAPSPSNAANTIGRGGAGMFSAISSIISSMKSSNRISSGGGRPSIGGGGGGSGPFGGGGGGSSGIPKIGFGSGSGGNGASRMKLTLNP